MESAPDLVIESDASNLGWGACFGSQSIEGQWSASETLLHINAKEHLAAFLALQAFASNKRGIHVRLRIDNMTAVCFINRKGGMHSKILMDLTAQIWSWSIARKILISAEHLPGRLNTIVDQESRLVKDSSEWKLDPNVFQQVMSTLGPCQVNLFASRLTAQLPAYMSWRPDPGAIATDALSHSWSTRQCYAFPPFSLVGRCLAKVKQEEVQSLVLVAPIWSTQPWFPLLLAMASQPPMLLLSTPTLLISPRN